MEMERITKYGRDVWSNKATDILRGGECLCLNCGLMNNGCNVSQSLYSLCKAEDIALMVTRCPEWKKRLKGR